MELKRQSVSVSSLTISNSTTWMQQVLAVLEQQKLMFSVKGFINCQ